MEGMEAETLGQKIKRLCLEKHISQLKLAAFTGLDESYVNRLANDRAGGITMHTAEALARAFEVSPAMFSSNQENPEEYQAPKDVLTLFKRFYEEFKPELEAAMVFRVPLMGTVPGGPLEEREAEVSEFIAVPKQLVPAILHPYAVMLKGNSLEGFGLHHGETLIVDPDAAFEDGSIYIVLIRPELTCKKIYKENDRLRLVGSSGEIEIMAPTRVENLGRVVLHGHWSTI